MDIIKHSGKKENTKLYISPLINDLVDAIDTDKMNNIIGKYIDVESEKSIFLMFAMTVMVYQVQLYNKNIMDKKEVMKYLLTDIFRDNIKRKVCLELFERNFRQLFESSNLLENEKILKN